MSAIISPDSIPSRSGMWPRKANPLNSSPPSSAFVSIITAPMYLKPTGISCTVTPKRSPSASTMLVVVSERTMSPRRPRFSSRYMVNSAITSSWFTYRPVSSMIPTRSASPSLAMPTSCPPWAISSIASGM